jgi:hypothetical protein
MGRRCACLRQRTLLRAGARLFNCAPPIGRFVWGMKLPGLPELGQQRCRLRQARLCGS